MGISIIAIAPREEERQERLCWHQERHAQAVELIEHLKKIEKEIKVNLSQFERDQRAFFRLEHSL